MSAATNALLFVTYGIAAACVALVLPQSMRGVDPTLAGIVGLCLFLGLAVAHEAWMGRETTRELLAELRRHKAQLEALRAWNANISADMEQVRRTLTQVADEADHSGLIAEMQLLQEHLDRLARGADRLSAIDTGFIMRTAGHNAVAAPRDEQALLADIRESLSANRVDVCLQPVVRLPQRKVEYFEAFSRIRNQQDEVLRPDSYIALAEREGLIGLIDNLLSFRCVQLVRRRRQRNRPIMCFVNISPGLLAEPEFFGPFADFLQANKSLADSLCFDLGQADVLERWELIGPAVERLAGLGFRFSMDKVAHLDMGFAQLAQRHIAFVKVPATVLLAPPAQVGSRYAPMDLKEAMARHGVTLVAHMVETERQVVELLDLNIELAQGYLFGEPKPARDG